MSNKTLKTIEEIEDWLTVSDIYNFRIKKDKVLGFIVDVDGNVDLSYRDLTEIPVKFDVVSGEFDCGKNKLENLLFAPNIVKGNFFCDRNKIASLKGCPKEIDGNFKCGKNLLISLEHCPEKVNGYFDCADNKIKDLRFCPKYVGNSFDCGGNADLDSIQFEWEFDKIYPYHLEHLKKHENEKLTNLIHNYGGVAKKNKI